MTAYIVHLSPELQQHLEDRAAATGITPAALITRYCQEGHLRDQLDTLTAAADLLGRIEQARGVLRINLPADLADLIDED